MNAEHEALKLAAMAATPGPWRECGHDRGGCTCGMIWSTESDELVAEAWKGDDMVPPAVVEPSVNAAYIALANPKAILSLLAENAALRAQVEAQEKRKDRAERALLRSGFVDNGAQEWKPPLGPAPRFIEVEAQPVPGWQLVPVDPTPEMYEAAGESLWGHTRDEAEQWAKVDKFESDADRGCEAYSAMLAAAPIPPAPAQAKEGT